jgi:hypothetical protein
MPTFDLGKTEELTGNVTTLQWIKPGFESDTEDNLGFHRGRLSRGYKIALLLRLPDLNNPKDTRFEFDGTTLRSGGRLGLPQTDNTADKARPRVHNQILAERGSQGYRALQEAALKGASLRGYQRIVRVLPSILHREDMAPAEQYPMGGGGLQWNILGPGLPFLIAVEVGSDGIARTPRFSVDLARGGYEARATLRRYMVTAPD